MPKKIEALTINSEADFLLFEIDAGGENKSDERAVDRVMATRFAVCEFY